MMKKITKNFLLTSFSLLSIVIIGCEADEYTGDSTLEVAEGVVATVNLVTPLAAVQTVNESDEGVYNYTITLNEAQPVDIHVRVKQIAGSADEDDFTFDNDIVFKAYTTSASGSITIANDDAVEEDEDFTLQIGDVNTSNATLVPRTLKFTIKNSISDDLELTFNFNKPFSISGTDYTLCGIGYDMDYYVLDSNFNDTGVYQAAASGCPESLTVNSSTFADGSYFIVYDIYADGDLSSTYHDPFDIPTTVDYIRPGKIAEGSFEQEADYVPNSTDGTGSDFVIAFDVLNGVYTLNNSIPQVIASGKADVKNKIKAAIANARLRNKK